MCPKYTWFDMPDAFFCRLSLFRVFAKIKKTVSTSPGLPYHSPENQQSARFVTLPSVISAVYHTDLILGRYFTIRKPVLQFILILNNEIMVYSHGMPRNMRKFTGEQWLTLAALYVTCNWLLKPVN